MADSTSTTLCEMNGRALEDQRDCEAQSCHGGHRVLVKVQDLDHMARHSLNWEEFFGKAHWFVYLLSLFVSFFI